MKAQYFEHPSSSTRFGENWLSESKVTSLHMLANPNRMPKFTNYWAIHIEDYQGLF